MKYRNEWRRLDFKAQYTFQRRYTTFLSIDNLTDTPNWTYNTLGRPNYNTFQGIGVLAGVPTKL